MAKITKEEALRYHAEGKPGKIEVIPTKPHSTQTDLSLAYSPGVAEPCLEIEKNPLDAYEYTAKGNLVAVISNGTAVLGLGDIGPLAGKPVMEGKGLLFKIFAGIDVFDIEVNEKDPEKFIQTVKAISPTFGGINLEDIKAPECFEIETRLKNELDIPVMHDDQHGTAIISGAGLINALEIAGKKIEDVKIVVNGAGAASISCTRLYVMLGARKENIVMCDSKGVISTSRPDLNAAKREFATDRPIKTLQEAVVGADVFLGLSVANVLTKEMVRSMNADPIVFALANPNPEISYADAMALHLLFLYEPVAPFFEKGSGGDGSVGGDETGNRRLQPVAEDRGNAFSLEIPVDVQPVQVSGGIHVSKSGNNAVFLSHQSKMRRQRAVPRFQVYVSRCPYVQLGFCVILCVDCVDRIIK